jgi:large subunit ribosomal protein L30
MGKIKVTQVKSAIKRTARQKRTLEALGIRKLHQTIEVEATPQIRGMVAKVLHLVKVEEVEGKPASSK